MKRFAILSVALSAVLFATAAESIDEALKPYREMSGAQYVDFLQQEEYRKEVEALDGEMADFHKSLKRFDMITADLGEHELDRLSQELAGIDGLTCIYSSEDDKARKADNAQPDLFGAVPPLLSYLRGYARKSGEFYTEFVYLVLVRPGEATIVYVEGQLREEHLKSAFPDVSMETKVELGQ